MITFIVTTYNLEDWLLRRCLTSIVAQGIASYEIIVVDDESDISPRHIVEEFCEQADIRLYTQKHSRQGAARNLALHHAKGQWIQFVDGDDYLLPNTVKSCLEMAEGYKLDLLMFGYREVYSQAMEHIQVSQNCMSPITSGNEYMLQHNLFGSCCTLLFCRALLDAPEHGQPLRFTEHIYIEDEEFVTQLVWRAQRMAKTESIVYAYYQRPESTTHNRTQAHTDELFRNYFVVLKRLLQFEASIAAKPHEGLTRKIRFLAIDIMRRTLREKDWKSRWDKTTTQLRDLGLYPIPAAQYSWKYRIFSLLSQSRLGRHLLKVTEHLS